MKRKFSIWLILTLLGALALTDALIARICDFDIGPIGFIASTLALLAFTLAPILILCWCFWEGNIGDTSPADYARIKKMRQAAEDLQFSFNYKSPCNFLGLSKSFQLFRSTFQEAERIKAAQSAGYLSEASASSIIPESRNVMEGTAADAQIAIFDFQCDSGNHEGGGPTQTVLVIKSPQLNFSHFAALPTTLWSAVGGYFWTKAVSAPSLPAGYQLITSDNAVDARISRLTDWLDGQTSIEAGEEFLLVYRRGELVKSENVKNLLTLGLHIYEALSGSQSGQDMTEAEHVPC